MKFYNYDLETFLECFLFIGKFEDSDKIDIFEISNRMNQRQELLSHLSNLQREGVTMVGFNSIGFDYPIVHNLLLNPFTFDQRAAYLLGQQIIKQEYGMTSIRPSERLIPQLDLAKVHGFDGKARRTSLKSLQFAMRLESVEDLPYDPHGPLTNEMIENLRSYGVHDVVSTESFLKRSKTMIQMRQELLDNNVIGGDVLNFPETKIGAEYLIKKIGRQKCYNGGQPKQTIRSRIPFKNLILPKIYFRTEHFQEAYNWFASQVFDINGEERPNLETSLAGLQFHFGLGGLHASVNNKVFKTNDDYIIKDIDVSGMYVAVAVANGFAPEHLGKDFVLAYKQLQSDRKQYPKGSVMNLLLKLAGNAVYGKSNDIYSPFYDPQYTYSVTVNGQLQLLQLVEVISMIPQLQIIQANTDGITVFMPRKLEAFFDLWCREWEHETGLKLEGVDYDAMWIRDVNNYIAITLDGKVKRKGAYWYPETEKDYDGTGSGSAWNKDFSNMVVQKAIEQVLINGHKPEHVVRLFTDKFDFMLRYKTTAGSKVFIGDKQCSKTVRYYVSTTGEPMKKISPPKGEIGTYKKKNGISDSVYNKILKEIPKGSWDERIHTKNKTKHTGVVTAIESGYLVKNCNDAKNFNWEDVNWEYYCEEIKKLII